MEYGHSIELIISTTLKLTLKIQKSVFMLYTPFLAQVSPPPNICADYIKHFLISQGPRELFS